MADADELARRTAGLVTSLARRAMGLATVTALVALVVGGLSYLTGLAALDGSVRQAWVVIGAAMLIVAVGAPLLARWRLGAVSRRASELVTEIASLVTRDPNAQRVVIETVAVEEPLAPSGDLRPVMFDSRQFTRLRQVSVNAGDLAQLPLAMKAVTTFPLLLLVAVVGVLVFGVLGFLFLVAWVL